jgi:hypothetical protein
MHEIEPFYSWRELYIASNDEKSPFFGRQNSEVYFEHQIYNYYIHPQWDYFGSQTLYTKLLYANYNSRYCILEMFGEWNDVLYNDIMYFYRNVIEQLIDEGIKYFILIGENVLNFHSGDDDYYSEWFDNIEDGWIIGINFRDHVRQEFSDAYIDQFIGFGGKFNEMKWRSLFPDQLFASLDSMIMKRLGE